MKSRLLVLLLAVLAAAGGYCLYRYMNETYIPRKALYADISKAEELNRSVRPDSLPEPQENGDSSSHEEKNALEKAQLLEPGVAAWITIPGTSIDHPVVQGSDNSYYLNHTIDGAYNQLGTPFLDCRCERDLSEMTSIVYGHHFFNDDSIGFGILYYFRSPDYMATHPTAVLVLPEEVHEVRFFAYMDVKADSFIYTAAYDPDEDKEEYLDRLFEAASYTTIDRSELDEESRLLLLSTCTGEELYARGVLAGVIE